ncbi:ferredoxin reductase family protein [Spirochaeta dissipatitropha]
MKKIILYLAFVLGLLLPVWSVMQASGYQLNLQVQSVQIAGLISLTLLYYQVILGSRSRLLDRIYGLDRIIHVHRWLGMLTLLSIVLHMLMYSIPAVAAGAFPPILPQEWSIVLGSLSMLIILVAGFVAAMYRRIGIPYQVWLLIHRSLYAVLPIVLVHGYFSGLHLRYHPLVQLQFILLTALCAALLASRWFRSYRARKTPAEIISVEKLTHDTVQIRCTRPDNWAAEAGQFVFAGFRARKISEPAHPFTVSSAPDAEYLELTIKAVGDFTSKVDLLEPGDSITLDGPYGVFRPAAVQRPAVWLAGGVGITPFLSAVRSLQEGDHPPVCLVWGNKSSRDICCEEDFRGKLASKSRFHLLHVYSHPASSEADMLESVEFGEQYEGFINQNILHRALHLCLGESGSSSDVDVFICGPPAMKKAIMPLLKAMGFTRLYYERFAL